MLGAGLVAKKAVEHGLTPPAYVKTSLAPGSKVVTGYLENSGLDVLTWIKSDSTLLDTDVQHVSVTQVHYFQKLKKLSSKTICFFHLFFLVTVTSKDVFTH